MFTNTGQVLCEACGSFMRALAIEVGKDGHDLFEFVCNCGSRRNFTAARSRASKSEVDVPPDAA